MHHAAEHGDGELQHGLSEPEHLEGAQPSAGQHQIDRAPSGQLGAPHVGALFVGGDVEPAVCEQDGEDATDGAGSDDDDLSTVAHDLNPSDGSCPVGCT